MKFTKAIVETADVMFSEDQNNISVDDMLHEYYRNQGTSLEYTAQTRKQLCRMLSNIRKILQIDYHYDICVIGKRYFDGYKRGGVVDTKQGHRCLPSRSKKNKSWGLHIRTGPDDPISNAYMEQIESSAAGCQRNVFNINSRGISNGTINPNTANLQSRKVYERFPFELPARYVLLPEIVNIEINGARVSWKWILMPKLLESGECEL